MEKELKDNVHPNAVSHEQTSKVAVDDIVRSASLRVDRGRWFLIALIEAFALAFLMVAYVKLTVSTDNQYDIAWVKMYKDGMWDIEFHDSSKALEVLPATIDSLLIEWTEKRYSEIKETVRFDYGFANLFLTPELSREFTSTEAFNAPQKAADVISCGHCPRVRYKPYLVDHFEANVTEFGKVQGGIYRTNIYVNKVFIGVDNGGNKNDKRIVRVDWRLMNQDEIKYRTKQEGGMDWLHKNPIGLEILAYVDLDDVSDKQQ